MHTDPSGLQILWFILIGILWAGYFVLEGFDFGVAMLVKAVGRDQVDKRMIIHTIGPVWDGNEVWLITAGGAMFAAFPVWYATVFSGFYLALFLVLACLIVRGVSFEFWGKVESPAWRSGWEWAMAISSALAALLFGVAWANFIHGVPMDSHNVVHVSLLGLLHPYAILGGVTTLLVFFSHGVSFLGLRVGGDLHERVKRLGLPAQLVSTVVALAFLIWTLSDHSWPVKVIVPAALTVVVVLASIGARLRSEGWSFTLWALAIALFTATLACALYPNALPSTTNPAFDLTLQSASSAHYTLVVMTVVAVIFVPIVLLYQGWTYWVFRHRLGRDDYEGPVNPIAVIEHELGSGDGDGSAPGGVA